LGTASVKAALKMLVKSTPGGNFANILRAVFMCLQFGFITFWRKEIGTKVASKMFVKLTTGVHVHPFRQRVRKSMSCLEYFCVRTMLAKLTVEKNLWSNLVFYSIGPHPRPGPGKIF